MSGLQAVGVTRRFGGLVAVDGVDLVAQPGEVTALIGPNGAGKTTLFACLAGTAAPDAGRVLLDDRDITELSASARARRGIGRTFQRIALFGSLTVRDNLLVGAESRRPVRLAGGLLGWPERDREQHARRVEQNLDRLGLGDVADRRAGTLPTGTQRLVELGRALCGDPTVLLLDEPASGLDTQETLFLQRVLRDLTATGLAVLLVEHDLSLVRGAADKVYEMALGRIVRSGTPAGIGRP